MEIDSSREQIRAFGEIRVFCQVVSRCRSEIRRITKHIFFKTTSGNPLHSLQRIEALVRESDRGSERAGARPKARV